MGILKRALEFYLRSRWAKILRGQQNPFRAQERAFKRLKRALRGCEVARLSGLQDSPDLKSYLENGRPSSYREISSLVDRHLSEKHASLLFKDDFHFVGLSSGTTGKNSKQILFNQGMIKGLQKYQLDLAAIIEQHSDVRLFRHKRLTWGSSAEVSKTTRGVSCGYVSGFLASRSPKIVEKNTFPTQATALELDMKEKIKKVATEIRDQDLKLLSGVPTYLINLLEALKDIYEVENFAGVWPNLNTIVYSATGIEPYRKQLEDLIGRPLNFIGCYISTEGPVGYEIPSHAPSGTYAFHYGDVVYSFRRLDKETQVGEGALLGVHELREGDEVELLVSAPNGLLNYAMGDCLKIRSIKPMITFEIMGRIGQALNIATEKVTVTQLQRAAAQVSTDIRHFFVYPGKAETTDRPCYSWTLFVDRPENWNAKEIARDLDRALMKQNEDYEEGRLETLFLDAPEVYFVASSVMKAYFERESHRGQLKMKNAFDSEQNAQAFLEKLLLPDSLIAEVA